ncbi:hypothetical protein [Umezawaea sp.]|uniref:hypothetical protein n=1 Tax=Umezawaea sp. TaxID=1955258 RepID=UPI002ED075A0
MRGTRTETPEWSSSEVDLLVRAARSAPVYGGGHPWVLEPHGRAVALYELPRHSFRDRLGIGRLLTCGGVLHNLHAALRAAGWRVEVSLPRDAAKPDLLAVLAAVGRQAVEERGTSDPAVLPVLVAANHWEGTRVRPVDTGGSVTLHVSTEGDSRRDVLLAGAALQAVRLKARELGLTATVGRGPLPAHVWASLTVSGISEPHPAG